MVIDGMSKEEIKALRAQERLKGLSPTEQIKEYYLSNDLDIILPDHVKQIEERVSLAFRLQCKGLSKTSIVSKLVKLFGVTNRTAYTYCRQAHEIFGEVHKINKDAIRHITYEMALTAYRMAHRLKDINGMNRALTNITKIYSLDKDDPDLPDFEKLKQSVNVVVLDPEIRDTFKKVLNSSGSVDLSKFINNMKKDAIDIEYTEAGSDIPDQSGDRPASSEE